MAGSSGTPLGKKLGIEPGATLYLDGAPGDYFSQPSTGVRDTIPGHGFVENQRISEPANQRPSVRSITCGPD